MKSNRYPYVCLLLPAIALLVSQRAAATPIVEVPPGSGLFFTVKTTVPPAAVPINMKYNAKDFDVLKGVLRKSNELAGELSIWSQIPKGGSCGTSSEALVTALKDVLPADWTVQQMWSMDLFNLAGGTGHAISMVSSPDGRHYFIDVYGGFVEMAEVVQHPDSDQYQPLAGEVGNMTSELILRGPLGGMNTLFIFRPATGGKKFNGTLPIERGATKRPVRVITSMDPNEIVGPAGYGDARHIAAGAALGYTVLFENKATASAAAQMVEVTQPLDVTTVDIATAALGPIMFSGRRMLPPDGATSFTTDVDLRPAIDLLVRVTAAVDGAASKIVWRFASLDPLTKRPTEDPLAGFLPPNKTPPEGDGSVSFTVRAKSDTATGRTLDMTASIVFDTNAPIVTNRWRVTFDADAPTSAITAVSPADAGALTVAWGATDNGAGVRDVTVYVATDGGAWTAWRQAAAAETSATFEGVVGQGYAFYTVAADFAGNVEPNLSRAQMSATPLPPSRELGDGGAAPNVDAGSAVADGGSSQTADAGVPASDAGVPGPDGGPKEDGGVPLAPDAGENPQTSTTDGGAAPDVGPRFGCSMAPHSSGSSIVLGLLALIALVAVPRARRRGPA